MSSSNWPDAFDDQDILTFQQEIAQAGSAQEIRDLLHEWEESGWATLDPEIRAAFDAPYDPVPLTDPRITISEAELEAPPRPLPRLARLLNEPSVFESTTESVIRSSFENILREEGINDQVTVAAIKRAISRQIEYANGLKADNPELKQVLFRELQSRERKPFELLNDLSQRGYAHDQVQILLARLLNTGELQLTHDRILKVTGDVPAYVQKRDAERHEALNQLAREAKEAGIYEGIPIPEGGSDV